MQQTTWQTTASIETIRFRAAILDRIRSFFKQKQVLEVETPVLSQSANCDPFIDSFSTRQHSKAYYLHTSPEFAMKRLLAAGSGDIYQVCKVFRKEESGRNHNPEFSLLEWYRTGFNDQDLIIEVAELINYLATINYDKQSGDKHSGKVLYPIEAISYRDCFIKYLSINPYTASTKELMHCAAENKLICSLTEQDESDRWLELLLSMVIEKQIGGTIDNPKMTFIYDYPASQASLARIAQNEYGEKVARRFELYFGGMELANGFYELENAQEQLQRFEQENMQREKSGKQVLPIDHHLIAALQHGLPSCAGVALGIDRLIMVMLGKKHINEVMTFSLDRA